MPGITWLPIIGALLCLIIIAVENSKVIRVLFAIILMSNFSGILNYTRPLPGTEATRHDVELLIKDCEKELPRHHKCVIDIGLRVDDGTTDYE